MFFFHSHNSQTTEHLNKNKQICHKRDYHETDFIDHTCNFKNNNDIKSK